MRVKLFAAAAMLLAVGMNATPAHAFILTLTATGDDRMTVSTDHGPYYAGRHFDDWRHADSFDFNLSAPGKEHEIIIHVQEADIDAPGMKPGAFLAQVSITPGSGFVWESTGTDMLTTNMTDWEYAVMDPLYNSDVQWYDPWSGWSGPSFLVAGANPTVAVGPQTNGRSVWTTYNGGPVAGIANEAMWIWEPENELMPGQRDTWYRLRTNIVAEKKDPTPDPVPEPGSGILVALGLAGAMLGARRK
ncbi:MAG: PEP-CTERM sorting domain-containing protein [Candidatus Eisenbacteria bacterium]|nr:PEP-CTERM sorting domain-containing protein [Candidatus Eisenbacteria bacterium]